MKARQNMANQVNHSQSNNNPYRYESQKSYDGRPCLSGEVLAPFVIKDKVMLSVLKINRNNLRTFKFGGKSVLVGFVPVTLEEFDITMKVFNADVHEYLSRHSRSKLDTTSLEEMMESKDDMRSCGYDPSAISSYEETLMLNETLKELIEVVYQRSPKHGKILKLIYGNYEITKQEIIAKIGMKKTQGYDAIKKAHALAKEVYKELNQ
ncbi:hypothetical protein ACEF08_05410 [Streptococcus suis]